MKNERRNKRLYKTISCVIVFFICVFAFVSLAICKASNNKVNAGVIVEQNYTITNITQVDETNHDNLYINCKYGSSNFEIVNCEISALYNNNTTLRGRARVQPLENWNSQIPGTYRVYVYLGSPGRQVSTSLVHITDDLKILLDMDYTYQHIQSGFTNVVFNVVSSYSTQEYNYFYQGRNVISSVNNIFDLPNNALTLLYINDVSGLNTSEMQNEITINWGYINSNDNTIYAEYAPTISAQNMQTDDKIIRLGVPLNAAGDAMDFYDISQQALLNISSLPNGSATAQAHIYGVYVWHNTNNIKWGLADFNTQVDPVPGSALNMNYITRLTELYDFQTLDTMNMTCRLSVSSNFNFITIKNQTNGPDKDSINAVIQQGGFLPAWSVYNWARGTYSGFIAGDASARADYLEGRPGYEAIYQAGYSDGFNSAELGTANWFITSFRAVDAFLSIHIFPNITFGVLLGIPFVISVAWFIIRMFRGGGGD